MKALGIDVGSSTIKGGVLDLAQGTVISTVSRPFPAPVDTLPEGWVEVDPHAVFATVHEVLSVLTDQAADADRIYFSGQMGGVILLDDQARWLTNYVSWRDQRTLTARASGTSILDYIRTTWESAGYLAELGNELQPGSTTILLAWPYAHQDLPRDAVPTCIADAVIARLAGHPTPMHATHAIGMLDLARDTWHRSAMDMLGLECVRLPELSLVEECVGTTVLAGRRFQLFGSYGDQQCALRGAALQRQELSLNISTGSQVSRRVKEFRPGPYQSRKYFFGDYLDTVTHIPAGRSLNVLVDLLTELAAAEGLKIPDPWKSIQRKVEQVADTDLEIDLAFFRSPLGDRGRIDRITTENLSVGTLFHAAYRAMADNYAQLAARFSPTDWRMVVLSGGLTQGAPRLRALIHERFAAPLRESFGEETLLGLLDIARATST